MIVLASLVALGVCASAASAAPLSMTFTEARANVGIQLSDEALFEAPDTASFEAQIDPESGAITNGVLQVPAFSTHITEPIDADVTVEFAIGIVTGSFDQATGALTLTGHAGGTLTADDDRSCTVSAGILTVTTAGSSGGDNPRSGTPFAVGLTGPGEIAGQWDDMTAEEIVPEDEGFCGNVENRIGGEGGVWLEHEGDLVPPEAPQLTGTDPASPGLSGTPRIRGAAEAGSTVRVYAGSGCTGLPVATASAAELASPGILVHVAEGVTAAFSATATDAAANTSECSAPISYTRLSAPPGPAPPPGPLPPPDEPAPELGFSLRAESESLRRLVRTRRLVVAVRVNRAANVRLTGRARLKVRGKPRPRLVPVFRRKAVRFADAGRKRVRLVLTKRGRRALRGLRRVRLVIAGRATDTAGETARARATLTLMLRMQKRRAPTSGR